MGLHHDVIVVGAGAAGIAAASELARRGRRVLVLEARDRIGGRILSEWPAGWSEPVELGAEFLHGGDWRSRAALQRAGVRIRKLRPRLWWRDHLGLRPMPDFWRRIARVVEGLPKRGRTSAAQFLERQAGKHPAEDMAMVRHYLESFHAGSVARLDGPALRPDHAGVDDHDFKPGTRYVALLEDLVSRWPKERVELRLNAPVSSVRWKRGEVAVTVRGRRELARAALITLPIGVLRANAVRFQPQLPRAALWKKLGAGHAVRIVLRLVPDFWERALLPRELRQREGRNFGFVNAPALPFPVWWALAAPQPYLTGWGGGPAADRLDHLSDARRIEAALRSLAELGGNSVRDWRKALVDARTHNWASDPWTRGAYSFSALGAADLPEKLAKPEADTLFFAGEAVSSQPGTVHGALESGRNAAKLLRRIG